MVLTNFAFNWAFFAFLVYAFYYLYIDWVVAVCETLPHVIYLGGCLWLYRFFNNQLFANTLLFGLLLLSNAFHRYFGFDFAWKYALALHLLGCFMQIVPGHAYFEGMTVITYDKYCKENTQRVQL